MGSSKKWAAIISSISASLYFCLVVSQIPLFSQGSSISLSLCKCYNERQKHSKLQQIAAVLAGSYLSGAGALIGARRMSLIRTLLLLWGLLREAIMFRFSCDKDSRKDVYIYPNMPIFVLCAFLSIRKHLRKIIHCCKAKHIKNYL
ncbi:hypothetical protein CISIN_1g044589mg [Citrus sinensis]|uniref:Transmembrane protein n=1 Tax=Citrus sinensis TaxID=2711 RepID=A0A067DAP8_CITSI|nr:hypothetical protein CISIN_1g044589mg [Citrus sinensis]